MFTQPIKRQREFSIDDEPAFKKNHFNSIDLPEDILFSIISQALTAPPRKLLGKYEQVSWTWNKCCHKIKVDLLNRGDHIRNIFSSYGNHYGTSTSYFGSDVVTIMTSLWRNVRALNFTSLGLNDYQFLFLSNLKCLQTLNLNKVHYLYLSNPGSLANDASCLSALQNLTELSLQNCELRDISFISNLTKLKLLDISNPHPRSIEISILTPLRDLEELHIALNPAIDCSFLLSFCKLRKLACSFAKFNAPLMEALSNRIISLESLSLLECNDLNQGIEFVAKLTGLTHLNLSRSPLAGVDLSFLLELHQLTELNLAECELSPNDIQLMEYWTTLNSLSIGNEGLLASSVEVEKLVKLTALTKLDITSSDLMNHNDLLQLSRLNLLKILHLTTFNMEGDELDAISHCSSVEELHLGEVNVDELEIQQLAAMPALRRLICDYPDGATNDLIARLEAAEELHIEQQAEHFKFNDISLNGKHYLDNAPYRRLTRK